ncbi:MAG: hypothetical protein GY820_21900, partial [Gammaproteobacteria bacterium]|nr:hypothetical protein [Gammaproteobacteria bacterium]
MVARKIITLLFLVPVNLTLPACNNPQQNKPVAKPTWPQEEILQQLSEQKQEINAPRKDLAAIQPTDPTTIKPDSDMAFVDSNTKVGYLS